MEVGWDVLLDIGDFPFSDGWGVRLVFVGFRVANMVDVRVVSHCM